MSNTKSNTNQHGNSELKDEEIIKALEHCSSSDLGECRNCPFYEQCENDEQLVKYTLDLINRQKAEIEALQLNVEDYAETIVELNTQCKELKAEIEMLKKNLNDTSKCNIYLMNRIDKAKSEAIKEFAERLKDKICNSFGFVMHGKSDIDIDNLLKEMTE